MTFARCTCKRGRDISGTTLALVSVADNCPTHGRPLSKRGTDDWTAIMGVTHPNQTESSQKVGVTPIH
jgi:hypothetical protein